MIQSSFPKVADQIITFNKNVVDILGKIDSATKTTDSTINLQITDENGILRNFAIPSFNSLKADIERLNQNINSLYSLDASGSLIETSNQNRWRKIISVDLNREPASISSVGSVGSFVSSPNWFFDSLLDPLLSVEFDLTGLIENNVRKCLVRRYIVDFAKDASGAITPLGQSALNSFNARFRGNANITQADFETWHTTTPGIVEPLNPKYDEQVFDLEPNALQFDGEYSVLRIQEDRINRKLWYVLDKLDYVELETGQVRQLAINNELIINTDRTSTRYRIIEVSTAESNPRIRVERLEGLEPIPVGIGTLKIYSPVIYTKRVRVSVGYDERNVIFMKPINTDNHLVAKSWSLGTGFWTNDLRLQSDSNANGLTMEQFYTDYVYDYGDALKDLVAQKIPNKLSGTPVAPTLNQDNFKVVQINKHLTDTPDSNLIKQKHNDQVSLKSEVEQISEAILERNKKLKVSKLSNESQRKQFELEIQSLSQKKESRNSLLATVSQEIIDISKSPKTKVLPKFRVRGFWSIPEAVVTRGTKPQEIVQFRIQYRYVSKDGKEPPIETFAIDSTQSRASFSNWNEFKTDARKRTFNKETGEYTWQIEDLESTETPNINQIDIPIEVNEKVEMRIKSISEVGWPESPVESDWSDILTVEFPDDLNNVLNDTDFILQEATKEDMIVSMNRELSARGLDEHLSDTVVINNKVLHHDAAKILSGFKDQNGVALDLFEYLRTLQDRVTSLEERIKRSRGQLQVIVLRNNQEFVINNGSETVFNLECEDYMDNYTAAGVPTGRVYANNIYVIKDFVVRFRNVAVDSALGLLSGRTYLQNPDVYNTSSPQTFWVNESDELLTSDITGQTRTQLNNQFIWTVNYDSVVQNVVSKVTENIGNSFLSNNNNSITNILSSNELNIGYNETSILSFVGNNKSVLDVSKWIDTTVSASSTNKLLTTIHPVVKSLETIIETNTDKVRTVNPGDQNSITVPLNIYFKVNALDTNQRGLNYRYVDFNNSQQTVKHIKKIKFFLENESENRPFTFTLKFNINRNKVILRKRADVVNINTR
jgi:hypothetical protein